MPYKEKIRKKKFFHAAVIYTIILVLAAMTGLALLWGALDSYESTTPKYAFRPIVTALEQGNYAEVMTACRIEEEDYFDEGQYVAYMQRILGEPGKRLTVREISSSTPDVKTFEISAEEGKGVRFYLSKEGASYRISQAEIPTKVYTIRSPEYVSVLVNGNPLTEQDRVPNPEPVASYQGVEESFAPKMAEYQVKGFVEEPEFRLEDMDASDYEKQELSDGSILFTAFPDAAEKNEWEGLALNAAKTYARFVCKDAERAELKKLMLSGTAFSDVVDHFSNYWYIEHESYGFENVKTENIVKYSPDHFTAEVSFDYTIQKERIRRVYPAHYRLAFSRENGRYLLANLELL